MVSKWVVNELESSEFGDKRLNKRVLDILDCASKQPQLSINKLFHTRKEVQACYRFFSNDLVDEKKLIQPHLEKSIERASKHPVVLCLSDTTSLNYTTRKKLKDSGYISSNNAQGFFLHATIAVTPDRLHLGLVGQKFWAREKKKKTRSSYERERMMLNEKESYRWLEAYRDSCDLSSKCSNSKVVHVTDREGDIFEIYYEYESRDDAAEYIVRSNHNRRVYSEGKPSNTLIQEIEMSPILGEVSFDIIDRETGTKRNIRQSIQALPVTIKSRYGADKPNLSSTVNAVYLKEIDPPNEEKRIVWCLLTSLPITTQVDIIQVVRYYLCRWEIEVFFKTYKSGCKVEEKSLRAAERLYPLFSLLLIVAWRVNFLLHMSRVAPTLSCAFYFEESEWKAGYVAATRDRNTPKEAPTMKEMMGYIAKLGGHLGRKNDPPPGVKAIWTGICKLTNYTDAWDLFGPGALT
jgi:hypothetical protein